MLHSLAIRLPGFIYRDAVLYCDRVPLTRLAEKFGTPLYVYSATAIRDRYRAFDRAFARLPHTICYSVKANSNLSLLKLLAKLGAGFDVISGGELERVLRAHKAAAKRVVFSGVGKTADEMDLALRAGILMFNVESEAELLLLAERAARQRKRARVALRVNPDVNAETHPYIATGLREHKFGIAIAEAELIYVAARNQKLLELSGVSVHIGSQITSADPFAAAMERVAELVRSLRSSGLDIRYVDAGGGLGIPYEHTANSSPSDDDFRARAAAYAGALGAPLSKLKVHLLLEPGRFIVGPSGALVSRVLYVKQNGAKHFVVVDAAMNDLIRPSLYSAYHEIVPVNLNVIDSTTPSAASQRIVISRAARDLHLEGPRSEMIYDVVGPICETGDFFARDRKLAELRPGDLIALLDAGAYGMSLASNYNTRPRAAEVLVDVKSARLIRRRETLNDLLRVENV
jgi:diaminopimelate decarboxylase